MALKEREQAANSVSKQIWLLDRLCYLFLVFISGSFVGWVYEEIFYWITEGALRNRGVLYGPWLPIYGIGALGIYAMKPLKKHPVLLFSLCVGITGIVEYTIGFVYLKYLDLRLWDYRGLFLNIGGLVCFRSVITFGLLGIFFHYVLEPVSSGIYKKTDPRIKYAVCAVLSAAILTDSALSALFRNPITY